MAIDSELKMVIFHSYVKLPEGKYPTVTIFQVDCCFEVVPQFADPPT